MKRPLQLPLAIALALGGTNALALGLGPVHVNSKLNQPLDAEIPILQGSAGEAEGLVVSLAAAEDFDRVGLNRARITVPLEFAVVKGSMGDMVIKVTSKDVVRDTFLDFLVEANWPKGRLLREYTVLLDPPVTAPATRTAAPAAVTTPLGTSAPSKRDVAAERAAAAPRATPPAMPKPAPTPSAHGAKDGEYGPVEAGETLSAIARAARPGDGTNLNQMMLALLKNNPGAFYKDNVNALKRGAILRIPSADEIKAVGSANEAAAQINSQVEDWRGGRASPTRVADSAAVPAATKPSPKTASTAAAAGKPANERLELVPPKAGKDSMAMADRPGSGAGSAAGTGELKSELARTKEALATREQESGELKSRVKELEDLKGKNDRMIGLKDSEIADLQRKLKEIQDGGKSATTKPATTVASTPATTSATAPAPAAKTGIDKQDIWGTTPGAAATATAAAAATKPAPAASTPPSAATSTPPVTPPSTTPPAAATSPASTPASSSPATTPSTVAPPASTLPAPSTPPTTTVTSAGPTSSTPTTVITPIPDSPSTGTTPSATPATTPEPAKPVVATPPKPVTAATHPVVVDEPWYEASWVKPAALGAGVLLVLLGFLGMRKKKPVTVLERGSIADSFGDSPLDSGDAVHGASASYLAEETNLREQLLHDPSNVGLHLELLSLYYAERDVGKFEEAAAEMHTYVHDMHQPEWLEAQAMGQELAPHNPLFTAPGAYDDFDHVVGHDHYATDAATLPPVHEHEHDEFADVAHTMTAPSAHVSEPLDSGFGFDLDDAHLDHPTHAAAPPVPATRRDEGFDFDLPPLDFDRASAAHAHDVPPARIDEEYFHGEDAIGTKLDLAKAYLDMGDPEGARSMLEEVVAEGSEAQKTEAHRLMAEIR